MPAYTLATNNEARKVLRVVCRWDFSPTLVAELLEDLDQALAWLGEHLILTRQQAAELKADAAAAQAKATRMAGLFVSRLHEKSLNARGKC